MSTHHSSIFRSSNSISSVDTALAVQPDLFDNDFESKGGRKHIGILFSQLSPVFLKDELNNIKTNKIIKNAMIGRRTREDFVAMTFLHTFPLRYFPVIQMRNFLYLD